MAITVLQQPYRQQQAPWWATMAEKVLVPMITGALERQRQRDEYRKENALRTEVENALRPQVDSTTGGGVLPSMSGQSSNGWENAFNSMGDSPLTQFDTGTAGIAGLTPFSSMSGVNTQVAQPRTRTRADIINAINQQRGLPRFSGVNPEVIDKMQKAMLDEYETQRLAEARNKAAEDYRNATTAIGRRDSMIPSVIAGDLPESFGNLANNIYTADRPQNSILNTGGQQRVIRVDPVTGETKEIASFENTLTPQQVQSGQQWNSEFDEKQRQFDVTSRQAQQQINNAQTNADRNYELEKLKTMSNIELQKWQMEQSKKTTQSIKNEAKAKIHFTNIEEIDKKIDAQREIVKGSNDKDTIAKANAQIDKLQAERNLEVGAIYEIYHPQDEPKYKSPGGHLLGEGNNIMIVKGGEFGADRGTHNHGGIDYAVAGGTKISPFYDMGTTKVVEVDTDPKNKTNYGCYVKLEGTHKGKRVRYVMAHMQEGSIGVTKGQEVKPGDIVGRVGSTGRSSGNHLHFEVQVWDGAKWQKVDPERFFEDAPAKPLTSTGQGNTGQAQQGANNAQQDNNPPQGGNANVNNANAGTTQLAQIITGTPNRQDIEISSALAGVPPMVAQALLDAQSAQVDAMTGAAPATQQNTAANNPQSNFEQEFADVLAQAAQGMPQYDLSDAELSAALPGSGVFPRGARLITPNTSLLPVRTQQNTTPAVTAAPVSTPYGGDVSPQAATRVTSNVAPAETPAVTSTPVDPDGGLSQYRADGDNSPVTWRNTSGQPMRTSDGQLFTQRIYDEWKQKADAGGFKDVGVNNGADLDKWLNDIGMLPDRPSEENGVNRLNGNPSTRADEAQDTTILPFNVNPSTSPEKFQAPAFTDEINDTTPTATQELLDGLNGITDSRYRNWTQALQRFHPEMTNPQIAPPEWRSVYDTNAANNIIQPVTRPTYTPQSNEAAVQASAAPQAQPQQRAAPRQAAPAAKTRAGRTNYEQQRNAVDGAAKRHGVDSRLIRAIIQTESSWNPNARSKVGAIGLMQLMPKTAKTLGVKNAYDPAQNIEGGTKYIAQLIKQFGGDVSKALMAYNCGPGNVKRGRIPAASKTYAKNVMSIYRSLK